MRLVNKLRSMTAQGAIWPPIDAELDDLRDRLRGKVLNAGAGWREVAHLIEGELVNQDIEWPGDDRTNIHIRSPLHIIPVPAETFDCILCIAVLEHVVNPAEVFAELVRVLKPGGSLIVSVPFLQPEHKVPTDYQRYTRDGLEHLATSHSLTVIDSRPLFTVYHTLHWIIYELLHMNNSLTRRALRVAVLPALLYASRHSNEVSDKLASAFRVVAIKPARD